MSEVTEQTLDNCANLTKAIKDAMRGWVDAAASTGDMSDGDLMNTMTTVLTTTLAEASVTCKVPNEIVQHNLNIALTMMREDMSTDTTAQRTTH